MNTSRKRSGCEPSYVRGRAFALGLLLVPLNAYWVISMEKVHLGPYPTVISIFANALFVLAALAGLNALVRRVSPSLSLSTAEMLIIYTMVAVSTASPDTI